MARRAGSFVTRCVSFEVVLFGFKAEGLFVYLAQPEGLGTQFAIKTKVQRPLTYLRKITQPNGPNGLGYVNRWAFGPKFH